jgi:predicted nucleotide-binding protein
MNKRRQKLTARRPKIFVGSSVESLDVAYAIQENLERDAEITVWPQGVFDLSRTTVQSLTRTLVASDFGIFVFAPNDTLRLRKKTYAAVRDNVLFELGMFVGRLGVERTFIVVPRNSDDLRIPTDLIGVTPGDYDAQRDVENLTAALGPVCNKIRRAIKETVAGGRAKSWNRIVPAYVLRNTIS